MGERLNGGADLVIDENLLGLANPMSTIAIGREDLVGADRPGAGLTESVREFIGEGGRAKLKSVRDAQPAGAPAPVPSAPTGDVRLRSRPDLDDAPEDDVRAERKA